VSGFKRPSGLMVARAALTVAYCLLGVAVMALVWAGFVAGGYVR
jgi:hypothetical protein